MGKQRVRCPRDDRVARLPAMIHLLSRTTWIMAVLSRYVSRVPPPYKIRDGQEICTRYRPSATTSRSPYATPSGICSHHVITLIKSCTRYLKTLLRLIPRRANDNQNSA